ncbi:protein Flattop [Musca domestica]|uniref:Cilia- and flagella-associated protein 126 n=1 Tax=Musca domestica TaxID=7370 RepID=A0A9J7DN88_MUSDO|nr:protein Flattop [Musca domestica]
MAAHYSANQFEQAYASRRLGNWEIPKWQTRDPPRPRQRKGSTQFIANERGHLLDGSKKLNQNPWGNFSGTYQLPDKLTRKFGDEYHKYLTRTNLSQDVPDFGVAGTRLTYPSKCKTLGRVAQPNKPLHSCEKKDVR